MNFPNSPEINDIFTIGDKSWRWNGYAWDLVSASYGPQGVQGIQGIQGIQGLLGEKGDQGTSIVIIGAVDDVNIDPPNNPQTLLNSLFPGAVAGNGVIDKATGELWVYDGAVWNNVGSIVGPQGIQGTQGVLGAQGIQGEQGIQGFRGFQGIQGTQGTQGERGIQGFIGFQGSQGPQGIQGTQGNIGIQGSVGPQGVQGFRGDVGVQGPTGPQGVQGISGFIGAQGIQGPQGPQGTQGDIGPQGVIGPQGIQGVQGPTGPQGVQGISGFIGAQGDQGPQGVQGPQGPQGVQGVSGDVGSLGPQGVQGPQGPQGVQGVSGDVGSLGPQGVQGTTGPQGPQGTQGVQGFPGEVGNFGPQGIQGPQGVQGTQGEVGSQGIQGVQGITGYVGSKGSFVWLYKNSTYTAQPFDAIIADTSGGSFTIILPFNPVLGDSITIVDGADWNLVNLFISSNGSSIEGVNEDYILDINDVRVDFVFDGNTWQVYTNIGRTGYTGSQGSAGEPGPIGYTGSSGLSENIFTANDDSASTNYLVFVENAGLSSPKISNQNNVLTFVPSTGTLYSVTFNSTSDERLKENVKILEKTIDKITKINGVSFNYKGNSDKQIGVIAQEVEQVFPELVSVNDKGYKTVSYGNLVAVLIESIKELNSEVIELKKELRNG